MSWKELSNEEDLPPEFTPPPRPRPPIDPPNGKDDLVNSDPTHFFTEIIENSAEIWANRSACQYLLSTPNIFSLEVCSHIQTLFVAVFPVHPRHSLTRRTYADGWSQLVRLERHRCQANNPTTQSFQEKPLPNLRGLRPRLPPQRLFLLPPVERGAP